VSLIERIQADGESIAPGKYTVTETATMVVISSTGLRYEIGFIDGDELVRTEQEIEDIAHELMLAGNR